MSDDLDQLGGIAVQIDHIARFARRHGAGVHGDTDIRLGQGRRIIRAVAAHGDKLALRLLVANELELHLRRRLGKEIIHPRFRRDGSGGQRIVAGDHHRADAHLP